MVPETVKSSKAMRLSPDATTPIAETAEAGTAKVAGSNMAAADWSNADNVNERPPVTLDQVNE